MKWYQDNLGNVSFMRIGGMVGIVVGGGLGLMGGVAMFMQAPAAGTAMSVGAGLITGIAFAKGLQKKAE